MEKEKFQYNYSSKQQEEIQAIRKKYVHPEQEDKMTQLRRLDGAVTTKATRISLTVGVLGALIMGFGMSLLMSDLKQILVAYGYLYIPLGLLAGFLGMALVGSAYPLYNRILRIEREKIAPEILRLTDELMK